MTPLNEALAPKICRYCANATGEHCMAGVPWYCASIHCNRFREEPVAKKPVSDKVLVRRYPRALVETF
jgi:hypothetical protein